MFDGCGAAQPARRITVSTPPVDYRAPEPRTGKRLFRSRRDRVVAGVAGGLAEYFAVDPVLLRVLMVALLIFTAIVPAVIFYIACIFLIPAEP
jgi:phage shock protein C